MKRLYYYLFYKLYKFWDYVSVPKFWSDFKAIVSIIALETWLFLSLFAYYAYSSKKNIELSLSQPIIYLPFALVLFIKYLAFNNKNVWKKYFKEFDRLPRNRNRIGSWVVFFFVILVVSNFIYSIYLYYNN